MTRSHDKPRRPPRTLTIDQLRRIAAGNLSKMLHDTAVHQLAAYTDDGK